MDIDVIVERKSFDVELEIGNPVVEVKAPDHYNGPFDIFPSDEDQIIPVKEKMPVEDICVKGIKGIEEITENGSYDVLTDKLVLVDIASKLGTLIKQITVDKDQLYVAWQIKDLMGLTNDGIYLVTAENNTHRFTNDKLDAIFLFKLGGDGTTDNGFTFKVFTGNWARLISSRTSPCYCGAGTILRCYRLPFPLSYNSEVSAVLESLTVSENGSYFPGSGIDGFYNVNVDVPSEVTYDEMASGTKPSGDITITVTEIVNMAFRDKTGITGVNAPNCTKIGNQAFMNDGNIASVNLPNVEQIGDGAFAYTKLSSLVLPSIKTIGNTSFAWISTLKNVVIGASCQSIGESLLRNTTSGWVCKFLGTPTSLASKTFYNTQGGDIYVPWSEGAVSGAPWGATSATIHYNTVYDGNWNVISST